MAGCGCCSSSRCDCLVTAGPGVQIDGDGSTTAPYVISADAGAVTCEQVRPCLSAGPGAAYDPVTGVISAALSADAGNQAALGSDDGLFVSAGGGAELQVTDTDTVDLTLTGDGSAGTPYEVSAAVNLDPAPPGGGTNLLQQGAGGMYVECADVRGCITAGDGIDVDPATGEISVEVSAQAGNQLSVEPDGLYVPAPAGGGTELQVTGTPSVDLTLTGTGAAGDPYDLSAAVRLDATPPGGGTNLIQEGPDGLYVECGDVRGCISAGDGIDVDPATGVISLGLSAEAGNAASIAGDGGLFVTPGAVSCEDVRPCLSGGDGVDYDPATGVIAAGISADAGNTLAIGTDGGLLVPPGGTELQAADTDTVDLTVTGDGSPGTPYEVSAAVRLDATPPGGGTNLIGSGPDGLYVECADVRGCITAGDGIDYDPGTGEIAARLSADAGNQAGLGGDGGIYVPPGTVTTADSGTVDLEGDGTGGNPITAQVIVDGGVAGNLLAAGPGGLSAVVAPGCGLDGDGTPATPLVVAASGTWPLTDRLGLPFACDDDNATSEIYCAADGTLHSRPEGTTVVGFFDFKEVPGVTLTAGQTRTYIADFPFINLSACRRMHVTAVARMFWDLAITPGTEWRVYGSPADALAPAPLGDVMYGDLHDGTATRRWEASFSPVGHMFDVAPGATVNFQMRLDVEVFAGSLTVFEQRVDATWHGTTI